jgi:hypothetical protein
MAIVTSGRAKNTGQYAILNLAVHNSNSFRPRVLITVPKGNKIRSADKFVGSFVYVLYGRNSKLGFATPCFVRPSIYDLDHA